jgi:hypothetical protein
LRIFVPTTFVGRRRMIILVDGGKRENRLDDCGTFERMEMSRNSFESLKS